MPAETMHDPAAIGRLAAMAIWRWGGWLDYDTRYQAAWSAIAERAVTDPAATARDLVGAGQDAVAACAQDLLHHHGITRDGRGAPRFAAYWETGARLGTSPEDTVVDRVALEQIWPRLTRAQQRTLNALADHPDQASAAQALGVGVGAVRKHLMDARKTILRLWHEGEQPSRIWARDLPQRGRQPATSRAADRRKQRERRAAA